MRTNGFIFIALSLTTAALAGTSGYLPSVGPVGLRFEPLYSTVEIATLPAPPADNQSQGGPVTREEAAVELPVEPPPPTTTTTLMHDAPVTLPEAVTGSPTNSIQTLIGPLMDNNGVITPQTFLRFFTPAQGGVSREAVIVTPPGFNPAQPPQRSSTATYIQTKP